MVQLFFSNSVKNQLIKQEFFKRLIFDSMKILKISQKAIVDLAIVGEGEMKKLNKKYRGKDKPTDVLSFSFIKNDLKLAKKDPFIFLGNIVICLPVAKKQAEKQKIPLKENLGKLAIHGLLHLLGYDHEKSNAERVKMERLEKILWQKANTL